jgi:hypothetical protein
MLTITNATKAQAIAVINAVFGVLAVFDVANLSDAQKGAVLTAANAVMALIVGVTYKQSALRIPDGSVAVPVSPAVTSPIVPPPAV